MYRHSTNYYRIIRKRGQNEQPILTEIKTANTTISCANPPQLAEYDITQVNPGECGANIQQEQVSTLPTISEINDFEMPEVYPDDDEYNNHLFLCIKSTPPVFRTSPAVSYVPAMTVE